MKRILLTSLIILSIVLLVACNTSGNNSNQQPPVDVEENQKDKQVEDNKDEKNDINDTFVYNPEEVKELDLEIELLSGKELEYDFDRDHDDKEMKELLSVIEINLDKPIDKMIEEILNHLEIKGEDLEEIDFEIKMYSGEKIGFKYHVGKGNKTGTIDDFDMDIKFASGAEWEYEYELEDEEFKIEYSDSTNLHGKEAQTEIERILSEVIIGLDHSISEMKKDFLSTIDVNEDDIREWDFEVEYVTGEKIQVEHDIIKK